LDIENLKGIDIVIVSTVPFFLVNQLASHIYNLKNKGMRITLVTSAGIELKEFIDDESIDVITVEIPRNIAPLLDLKALFILIKLFARKKFTIMHSTTPKAGLLCAIAAKITGVPLRLHTFTGQVWATKIGLMRWMLQFLDKSIIRLNTHCYADSPSQRELLINMGIAKKESLTAYGKGSLAGVDLQRFSPQRFGEGYKSKLRDGLNINDNAFVITFIGRLTRDKGIYELLASFQQLKKKNNDLNLIILGPMEETNDANLLDKINGISNIHWLGNVSEPEKYLLITDVLCLPSYREGFGTVVIEASAMGVPAVASKIPGLVDAVEDGVTGILVPRQDENRLTKALERLISDKGLLKKMKIAARDRCVLFFDSKKVNEIVEQEYLRWLRLV